MEVIDTDSVPREWINLAKKFIPFVLGLSGFEVIKIYTTRKKGKCFICENETNLLITMKKEKQMVVDTEKKSLYVCPSCLLENVRNGTRMIDYIVSSIISGEEFD